MYHKNCGGKLKPSNIEDGKLICRICNNVVSPNQVTQREGYGLPPGFKEEIMHAFKSVIEPSPELTIWSTDQLRKEINKYLRRRNKIGNRGVGALMRIQRTYIVFKREVRPTSEYIFIKIKGRKWKKNY